MWCRCQVLQKNSIQHQFDALELSGNCKQNGYGKGGPKSDSRYEEHDNKNKAEKEQVIHSVQTYFWNDLRKNKNGNACVQNKRSNHEIFEQCNRDGRYSQFVFAVLLVTVALGYIIVAGLLFWHFLSTHNSWLFSEANFLSNPVKIVFFYSFGVIGAYSFVLMLRTLTEFSFRIPALLRTVSEVGLLVSFFWPVPLYLIWGMWGCGALCLLSGLLLAFIWTRVS